MSTFDKSGVEPFLRACREAAGVGLLRVGEAVGRSMQRTLSGPSPSPVGSPPGVSDGTLRRSIHVVPIGQAAWGAGVNPHVRVGSNVFYGLVQETGNWGRPILPVTAKFLLIPLSREARRMYRAAGYNARAMDLRLIPRRGKPTLLAKELGKSGKTGWRFKPLFILKKSVRLPRRPWAMPALNAARPQLESVFAAGARQHLRSRIGGAA